jgi:Co/Zn/Cd efflux system component
MMNDIAAFVVQLYANEVGALERPHGKSTTAFSYGFGRVEFLANLIQGAHCFLLSLQLPELTKLLPPPSFPLLPLKIGVLLLALCLTLSLESLQRFYSTETITLPPIVVGMGLAGLIWNLVMFRMFEGNHDDGEEVEERSLVHPSRYRMRVQEVRYFRSFLIFRFEVGKLTVFSYISVRCQLSLLPRSRRYLEVSSTHRTEPQSSDFAHLAFFPFFTRLARAPRLPGLPVAGELACSPRTRCTYRPAVHARAETDNLTFVLSPSIFPSFQQDAAGNFAVIIDGIASWLFGPSNGYVSGVVKSWTGVAYCDPFCSLVVVYVILIHAFPLVYVVPYSLLIPD